MWHHVDTCETHADATGFWNTLDIWLKKPHVVNRRLCASQIICQQIVYLPASVRESLSLELREHGQELNTEEKLNGFLGRFQQRHDHDNANEAVNLLQEDANITITQCCDKSDNQMHIIIRDLLPRQIQRYCTLREAMILDLTGCTATYIPVAHISNNESSKDEESLLKEVINNGPSYMLHLQTELSRLCLSVDRLETSLHKNSLGCSEVWLKETLLPKLARWSGEEVLNTEVSSLKLVSVEKYNKVYQELKAKYASKIIQTWPEGTDPLKYVYEDIAIAAYLLVLWEDDRVANGLCHKQSFVDLGCGNGLLVHLLCSEGHIGKGMDIRKRKIWDLYGQETSLQEVEITPGDSTLYPEYDWLIGNHSDELTPWIPVIAARSGYKCSFFVLPCCPWDFVGKFSEKKGGMSQYQSYLGYIESVGSHMGFSMECDALRIPSTKRACFVGRCRTYPKEEDYKVDIERTAFISKRSMKSHNRKVDVKENAAVSLWATDFKARDKVEKIRNCITVDESVKKKIILCIFNAVLGAADAETLTAAGGCEWNKGGNLSLSQAISLIDKDTLKHLKSECGGLQTLLKNASHVFKLQAGGISLRITEDKEMNALPRKKRKKVKKVKTTSITTKTKLCFFHDNHPDGCFYLSADCRFAHGPGELVAKVSSEATKSDSRDNNIHT